VYILGWRKKRIVHVRHLGKHFKKRGFMIPYLGLNLPAWINVSAYAELRQLKNV
jgi:hypothetical protein